jgi:hypothetical protein
VSCPIYWDDSIVPLAWSVPPTGYNRFEFSCYGSRNGLGSRARDRGPDDVIRREETGSRTRGTRPVTPDSLSTTRRSSAGRLRRRKSPRIHRRSASGDLGPPAYSGPRGRRMNFHRTMSRRSANAPSNAYRGRGGDSCPVGSVEL